jgi:hypothetical protein
MTPAGFKPEIQTSERSQTHALARAVTDICTHKHMFSYIYLQLMCGVKQTGFILMEIVTFN